jgi:tetratricopeptide (TPR) repeat protein
MTNSKVEANEEKESHKDFDKAPEINNKDLNEWYDKGIDLLDNGEDNEAFNAFNHCINLDPYCADAWVKRGRVYLYKNKYDEAIIDFDKSLEILNNTAETNIRDAVYKALLLAKIYIAQNSIDEAKLKLLFVIENGNNLIDVQIAENLLAKI